MQKIKILRFFVFIFLFLFLNFFSVVEISETETIYVQDILVADSYAYVTTRDNGLHIIDITNPKRPKQVNWLGEFPLYQIYSYKNFLFITSTLGTIYIFDITDPIHPTLVRRYIGIIDGFYEYIVISGDLAYLPCEDCIGGSLVVYNISDPMRFVTVASYDYYFDSIYIQNNLIYALNDTGMLIFDNTNLQEIKELSFFPHEGVWYNSIFVYGNYSYVESWSDIHILDISNSTNPHYETIYEIDYSLHDTIYSEKFIYCIGSEVFEIISIETPDSPERIALVEDIGRCEVMDIFNNYIIYYRRAGKIIVMEISDLYNPSIISTYQLWIPSIRKRNHIILTVFVSLVLFYSIWKILKRRKLKKNGPIIYINTYR